MSVSICCEVCCSVWCILRRRLFELRSFPSQNLAAIFVRQHFQHMFTVFFLFCDAYTTIFLISIDDVLHYKEINAIIVREIRFTLIFIVFVLVLLARDGRAVARSMINLPESHHTLKSRVYGFGVGSKGVSRIRVFRVGCRLLCIRFFGVRSFVYKVFWGTESRV